MGIILNRSSIRSVGVSNFGIAHLEGLRKTGRATPSTNQIELHPMMHRQELVDYCREHDIAVMGFSPLAKGKRMTDQLLNEMAARFVHVLNVLEEQLPFSNVNFIEVIKTDG